MTDHIVTVTRRVLAEIRTTEDTLLDDNQLAEFEELETAEEKYRFLADLDLDLQGEIDVRSERQILRYDFEVA